MKVMVNIQVRNVPDDVHRTLKERAARAGMSLQEYVLSRLCGDARMKTPAEIVAEVEAEMAADPEGWATESSVEDIRRDRDSR